MNIFSRPFWTLVTSLSVFFVASAVAWRWQLSDRDVLQRKFWDFVYDRYSFLYDIVDWITLDAAQKIRLKALDHLPHREGHDKQHILEVGVGTGRLHVELAKCPNINLSGFDLAPGMIQLTQNRLHGVESDLHQGDVTKGLPWKNDTFDVVVSTFVLSAISNATVACQEMTRVLKPGGCLMIIDAGTAQDGNWKASFLAWLWELMGDYMRDDDAILTEIGMVNVTREDYGPWNSVHLTIGNKAA